MDKQTNKNGSPEKPVAGSPVIEFDEFDDELKSMQELIEIEEITLTDESFEAPIRSLDLQKAIVVESGTSLRKCIDKMLARKIGCMLIVKDGRLQGIFTERDVLRKIAGSKIALDDAAVDQYMTSKFVALKMNDMLKDVLRLMHEGRYRHVPIVDGSQKPIAVVSIKDIINFIVEFFPQDVLNLPPHPIRVGTKNREGG